MPGWVHAEGPAADVALSTRARLARNIDGITFPFRSKDSDLKRAADLVSDAVHASAGRFGRFQILHPRHLSEVERLALVDSHVASEQHVAGGNHRLIAINESGTLSLMVNEEDHLRIQCILPGLQPLTALEMARSFDSFLGERIRYAQTENYGYLTSSLCNLGTGLRVSAMLHLAGLAMLGQAVPALTALGLMAFQAQGITGGEQDKNKQAYGKALRYLIGIQREDGSIGQGEKEGKTEIPAAKGKATPRPATPAARPSPAAPVASPKKPASTAAPSVSASAASPVPASTPAASPLPVPAPPAAPLGKFFNQALATLALAENYGMTGKEKAPAEKALRYLAGRQLAGGGWAAAEGKDADREATAWATLALLSAEIADLPGGEEALAGAEKFWREETGEEKFLPEDYTRRRGPRALALFGQVQYHLLVGRKKKKDRPREEIQKDFARLGVVADYLADRLPAKKDEGGEDGAKKAGGEAEPRAAGDLVSWGCTTAILHRLDGGFLSSSAKPRYVRWAGALVGFLAKRQEKDGSWPAAGFVEGEAGGKACVTALALSSMYMIPFVHRMYIGP